jgi:hypothetical protein
MIAFRKKGGEQVSGAYWSFDTGERVSVGPGGVLPGPASRTYYRVPRGIVLSLLPLAAIVLVDVLPNMLKSLYAEQAGPLVFAYGAFVCIAMVGMLAVVFSGALKDLLSRLEVAGFGWRPGMAYLSGRGKRANRAAAGKEAKK